MASDIWLRTIPIVRKETHCCHIGYSFRLAARVLLYASSHGLCYTSCGALAATRNSPMGTPWRIDLTTHRTMSELGHKVKDHWDNKEGNHFRGSSFCLTARIVYNRHHRQDRTYHSIYYTSCIALVGTRNSSKGLPFRIYTMTHRTMKIIQQWTCQLIIIFYFTMQSVHFY